MACRWCEGTPLFGAGASRTVSLDPATGRATVITAAGVAETWELIEYVGQEPLETFAKVFEVEAGGSKL